MNKPREPDERVIACCALSSGFWVPADRRRTPARRRPQASYLAGALIAPIGNALVGRPQLARDKQHIAPEPQRLIPKLRIQIERPE
jgi:hypothetical protein